MSARKCLIAFLCLFLNLPVYSQETGKVDNSLYMVKSEESLSDSVGKKQKNIFQKVLSYFDDSNKPKTYKKFDFSIIGGPHYSTDTKLGLGLVAAGLYRTNMSDTIMPFSNVSLFGDVTTVGFYLLGIRGNHLFQMINTGLIIHCIFSHSLQAIGESGMIWEMMEATVPK